MKILIAEDDPVSRRLLEATLVKWGYQVAVTSEGREALRILQAETAPILAILDWMMPGLDGTEVCRKVCAIPRDPRPYLILLTARTGSENIVQGLNCGADDYVTKPFDRAELGARVRQGCRILDLQARLIQRAREAEEALAQVKQLRGLLPVCCYCKKIRDDRNYWQQVDTYLTTHLDARVSHGICPECLKIAEENFERSKISNVDFAPRTLAIGQ